MQGCNRDDPNVFPPTTQFRYRRELDESNLDEGFDSIERLDFAGHEWPGHDGRALLRARWHDPQEPERRSPAETSRRRRAPARPARRRSRASRQPASSCSPCPISPRSPRASFDEATVLAACERTRELLALDLELAFCPHGPGPPVCWCRKPLPGLGVLLIERHRLDPRRCLVVASSAADRGFAERLGSPTIEVDHQLFSP
jgi:hypothetical protein